MDGSLLILFLAACGFSVSTRAVDGVVLSAVPKYALIAKLSMGRLRGGIQFLQREKNQALEIKVELDAFSGEGDFGIYSNPMIYNGNANDSCGADVVGKLISNGNLTEKHGPFTFKMTLSNDRLKAYGRESILGCSVVIRHRMSSELWGCATILPFDKEALYATAKLKGPVAGEVRFLQNMNDDTSNVLVVGELYYTDGKTRASDNHGWYVSSSSASEFDKCTTLTTVLKSETRGNGSCSIYEPGSCDMGDLSSKLGTISIGIANTDRHQFRFIDLNLAVSKVIGHALVIRDLSGEPVACANILKNGPITLSSVFSAANHDGVSGYISFKQDSPYHPTTIHINLNGLAKRANGYHVHKFPIPVPAPTNPCANSVVAGHLNPYGIVKDATYPADGSNNTMDKYELGDLSGKFGNLTGVSSMDKQFVDVQLDLFGRYGILNRGLVIHHDDATGSRWICANIVPDSSSKQLSATSNFSTTSGLNGIVSLVQFMMPDGVLTDTGITIDLAYKQTPSQITRKHDWHVHLDKVGDDWQSELNKRCRSVGGHYNPYNVNTQGTYQKECSPTTPFRCEVGDLAEKQTEYDIGAGKRYFLDTSTPLFGITSVIGRSFAFHAENDGAPRLACADIIPDSIAAVAQIDMSFPEAVPFNKSDVRVIVAQALNISQWQVRYVKSIASSKPCRKIRFFIIDDRQPAQASDYKTKIMKLFKEKKLNKYIPCPDGTSGSSRPIVPSIRALLFGSLLLLLLPLVRHW